MTITMKTSLFRAIQTTYSKGTYLCRLRRIRPPGRAGNFWRQKSTFPPIVVHWISPPVLVKIKDRWFQRAQPGTPLHLPPSVLLWIPFCFLSVFPSLYTAFSPHCLSILPYFVKFYCAQQNARVRDKYLSVHGDALRNQLSLIPAVVDNARESTGYLGETIHCRSHAPP